MAFYLDHPPMTAPIAPADLRSAMILASVHRAFMEKGFDGASMQDLAREAGMSVGNFYRYFPSKAAIVEAIITLDLQELERDFSAIIGSANPMQSLRDTIKQHVEDSLCNGEGQLWAEITAAAMRKPDIAAIVGRMEIDITHYLTTVFSITSGLTLAEAVERFSGHAALVVLLVKASAMQACAKGSQRADLTALVLRTINQTLDEIPQIPLKG
jgi:AcrR family transcriptional regulator